MCKVQLYCLCFTNTIQIDLSWLTCKCCIMSSVCVTKLLHSILKTYLTRHHLSWNPKPWHHPDTSQRMSLHGLFMSDTTVKACSTSLFQSLNISLLSTDMSSLPPDNLKAKKQPIILKIILTWKIKWTLLTRNRNNYGLLVCLLLTGDL